MKRIIILSIFAALICGCNTAGHEGQGSANDTVSVDSVANVVIAEPEPAEPEPPFTTPDLKWKQLQGNVKQLKIMYDEEWYEVYNFDREGKFVSYNDSEEYTYKIKRNKMGQIKEWHKWIYDTDADVDEKYSYNSDGYICKVYSVDDGGEKTYVYVLNEHGWPVSASWKLKDWEGNYYKGTVYYSYSDIDDHGNWRKCVVKCKSPDFFNYTQTRKITYWE